MIVTKSIVMTKAEEGEQMLRVRTFEVSNESVDRDGDIVKQSGVDWKNFMKNPVVLFAHNSKELPIGKGLQVRRVGTKTLMDIGFAAADANPKADQVLKLLDGGFLNASSIGFVPLEAARVDTKGRTGFDITKAEALEFSIVPVPANPDALVQAKEAGLDVAVMKDFLADALKGFRLNEAGEIEAIRPRRRRSRRACMKSANLRGCWVLSATSKTALSGSANGKATSRRFGDADRCHAPAWRPR